MASSSSTIDNYGHYDVFISFRGEDTRYNFTSHLNEALCRNNIKAFIDDKIDRGDAITPALERVIDGAKISIIVFSKNYAESTFCLDELVRIMECKESKAQTVLPIFYKVDPSKVTYEETFARHETNTKVERWKSAFGESIGLAGWHIVENSVEAEVIGKITKVVSEKLNNNLTKGEELMYTSMVGQKAEDNFKHIWECLMDDKISRVGVHGMGGVGKTTIATRINDQLLATVNSFSHVCWVTVSRDLSICDIQNKIAKMMKIDFSREDDERKRAAKLRKRLKTEKFVLILDDVWEAFEIEDVGLCCLLDGQKLLLTSRSLRVCERMECLPIEVKPLSEKEALDLFIKESKYQINNSQQCWDIMSSIVKECGGLPLAIVVIGRSMKGVKEIWKWRNALREFQKPCERENPEIEDKVYKVLKFSYDCLRNDMCRQCFLYCSLFPEDHSFKRDDLILYWIGEGLVNEIDSWQAELDKGNVILDELIDASLLQSRNHRKSIKMHDVIRDMARMNLKVGLKFGTVQVHNSFKSFPNSTPNSSKLTTLLLFGYYSKEPSSYIQKPSSCFFANMQSLNVLHISCMDKVKSIPDYITNLGNLRLLTIESCKSLEYIPSLAGLKKLQYLSITLNMKLYKAPKGIEKLVNLRVLKLLHNRSLVEMKVEAEALISLEKLEVLDVHFHDLHTLNCYLQSGNWRRLHRFFFSHGIPVLPDLQIKCIKAFRDVEEWNRESGFFLTVPDPYGLQYLELKHESPMSYYLKNSNFVNLRFKFYRLHKSRFLFTVDLVQRLLHNVKELEIRGWLEYDGDSCDELEEIVGREEEGVNPSNYINYPPILLPNLKRMELSNLPETRSIYRGKLVCPSLEFIWIGHCDKIERLPFCVEKDDNKQNITIQLFGKFSRRWWESLQWDDPNAKSMYRPIFDSYYEDGS